jgi:hypothetical protein
MSSFFYELPLMDKWQRAGFLVRVRLGQTDLEASRMVGLSFFPFLSLRKRDPEFRAEYEAARDEGASNRAKRSYWKNPGRGRRPPIKR